MTDHAQRGDSPEDSQKEKLLGDNNSALSFNPPNCSGATCCSYAEPSPSAGWRAAVHAWTMVML